MQNTQQGKIFVKNPDMLLSWYGSIPYDEAKKTEKARCFSKHSSTIIKKGLR